MTGEFNSGYTPEFEVAADFFFHVAKSMVDRRHELDDLERQPSADEIDWYERRTLLVSNWENWTAQVVYPLVRAPHVPLVPRLVTSSLETPEFPVASYQTDHRVRISMTELIAGAGRQALELMHFRDRFNEYMAIPTYIGRVREAADAVRSNPQTTRAEENALSQLADIVGYVQPAPLWRNKPYDPGEVVRHVEARSRTAYSQFSPAQITLMVQEEATAKPPQIITIENPYRGLSTPYDGLLSKDFLHTFVATLSTSDIRAAANTMMLPEQAVDIIRDAFEPEQQQLDQEARLAAQWLPKIATASGFRALLAE